MVFCGGVGLSVTILIDSNTLRFGAFSFATSI
jgi:hypothetical protein